MANLEEYDSDLEWTYNPESVTEEEEEEEEEVVKKGLVMKKLYSFSVV